MMMVMNISLRVQTLLPCLNTLEEPGSYTELRVKGGFGDGILSGPAPRRQSYALFLDFSCFAIGRGYFGLGLFEL